MMKYLLVVAALLAVANADNYTFVWARSTGEVVQTGSAVQLNVTRLSVGHYCVYPVEDAYKGYFGYAAVTVTLQTEGAGTPVPGHALVNSGWGDDCNPYRGFAVQTYDILGSLTDRSFSALVAWNGWWNNLAKVEKH